jgi:hypothetical protein
MRRHGGRRWQRRRRGCQRPRVSVTRGGRGKPSLGLRHPLLVEEGVD